MTDPTTTHIPSNRSPGPSSSTPSRPPVDGPRVDRRQHVDLNLRQLADGNQPRHSPQVAMTCAATPEVNVLIRATARLVDKREEAARRWAEGVLPYDAGAFFSGPDDPEALFVELRPTTASIHSLAPGPVRRWTPS